MKQTNVKQQPARQLVSPTLRIRRTQRRKSLLKITFFRHAIIWVRVNVSANIMWPNTKMQAFAHWYNFSCRNIASLKPHADSVRSLFYDARERSNTTILLHNFFQFIHVHDVNIYHVA